MLGSEVLTTGPPEKSPREPLSPQPLPQYTAQGSALPQAEISGSSLRPLPQSPCLRSDWIPLNPFWFPELAAFPHLGHLCPNCSLSLFSFT